MLKTKQWSTVLFRYRFLLIMLIAITMPPAVSSSAPAGALQSLYPFKFLVSDTTIAANNDSLNAANKEEAYEVPDVPLNPHMHTYIESFLRREKESLRNIQQRSERYFAMIDSVFEKYDLPEELKYLAVVESDLKTKVVSRSGAAGLWQLMPGTARSFGLKVTSKHDERKHSYKSTVAAAKYLKTLYRQFGDWLLVIAAYNGGSGTILKAIRKSGSHNFWKLQYALPMETRVHVKRYIGTHYFFEGEGGLTTLTKKETAAYMQQLAKIKTAHQSDSIALDKPLMDEPVTATSAVHTNKIGLGGAVE
jgi:membrane-bound lytic murein transglycosylase D